MYETVKLVVEIAFVLVVAYVIFTNLRKRKK